MEKNLDFQTAKEIFLRYGRGRGLHPKTLEAYAQILSHFFDWLDRKDKTSLGQSALGSVTREDIETYGLFLKELSLSPATRATYFLRLKIFFKFMEREHRLLINPAEEIRIIGWKTRRLLPVVLTKGEMAKVLDFPFEKFPLGLRDRALWEILYSCGLRVSELIRLTWDDIAGEGVMIRQGKGNKDRFVPLGRGVKVSLTKYRAELWPSLSAKRKRPEVFLSYTGRRLSKSDVSARLKKYTALSLIKKRVYPHLIRHTMATHLLEQGAPLPMIQEMLGHSRLETTQIYTQVNPADLKKWVNRCHPRSRFLWKSL